MKRKIKTVTWWSKLPRFLEVYSSNSANGFRIATKVFEGQNLLLLLLRTKDPSTKLICSLNDFLNDSFFCEPLDYVFGWAKFLFSFTNACLFVRIQLAFEHYYSKFLLYDHVLFITGVSAHWHWECGSQRFVSQKRFFYSFEWFCSVFVCFDYKKI